MYLNEKILNEKIIPIKILHKKVTNPEILCKENKIRPKNFNIKTSLYEKQILDKFEKSIQLASKLDPIKSLSSFYKGAMFVFQKDDGIIYETLIRSGLAYKRTSTHFRDSKYDQYGIDFKFGTILIGKTKEGCTFFQTERFSTKNFVNLLGHIFTAIIHFLSLCNINIGINGFSVCTEKKNRHIVIQCDTCIIKQRLQNDLNQEKSQPIML